MNEPNPVLLQALLRSTFPGRFRRAGSGRSAWNAAMGLSDLTKKDPRAISKFMGQQFGDIANQRQAKLGGRGMALRERMAPYQHVINPMMQRALEQAKMQGDWNLGYDQMNMDERIRKTTQELAQQAREAQTRTALQTALMGGQSSLTAAKLKGRSTVEAARLKGAARTEAARIKNQGQSTQPKTNRGTAQLMNPMGPWGTRVAPMVAKAVPLMMASGKYPNSDAARAALLTRLGEIYNTQGPEAVFNILAAKIGGG